MIRQAIVLVFGMFLLGGQSSFGQEVEDEAPSKEEEMAELAALGPGVHHILKDKEGNITSCMVVGQARISTVLGKAKGLEIARDKANLACSTEFIKWLKEEVTFFQSNEDETIFLMEGSEGDDDESLSETGKSIDKNSRKSGSISKGLVRGLQIIHKDVDSDGETYTVIKGWSARTAQGVKKVASDLASDEPESKKAEGKGKKGQADGKRSNGKSLDKEYESSSVTSDAAEEFLPKRKR